MVQQHMSFPSIVMWVVFNEGWGQYETERVVSYVKVLNPHNGPVFLLCVCLSHGAAAGRQLSVAMLLRLTCMCCMQYAVAISDE